MWLLGLDVQVAHGALLGIAEPLIALTTLMRPVFSALSVISDSAIQLFGEPLIARTTLARRVVSALSVISDSAIQLFGTICGAITNAHSYANNPTMDSTPASASTMGVPPLSTTRTNGAMSPPMTLNQYQRL